LFEIFPEQTHDNDLLNTTVNLPVALTETLNIAKDTQANVATNSGHVVGIILPAVTPEGYSGDISMIIGIRTDGSIAGVRVLSHKETPGLGDNHYTAGSGQTSKSRTRSVRRTPPSS